MEFISASAVTFGDFLECLEGDVEGGVRGVWERECEGFGGESESGERDGGKSEV